VDQKPFSREIKVVFMKEDNMNLKWFLRLIDNKYTILIFRIMLGLGFIYASVEKILFPMSFADSVSSYQVVPRPLLNIVAIIFPWCELVAGLFLLNGFKTRSCNIIILLMLCLFNVLIISVLARGLQVDCGCFSSGSDPIGIFKLLQDCGYLLLSLAIFFYDKGYFSLDSLLGREVPQL
jgi:putative oxidoreductase